MSSAISPHEPGKETALRLGHWRLRDVRHVTAQVHRKPEPRMHLRLEEPPSRHITSLN